MMHKVHNLNITYDYFEFLCSTLLFLYCIRYCLIFYMFRYIWLINSYIKNRLRNLVFSVSKMHYICYVLTDATSVTFTLLRLISSLDESDGRCVHVLEIFIFEFYKYYCQVHLRSIFIMLVRYLY